MQKRTRLEASKIPNLEGAPEIQARERIETRQAREGTARGMISPKIRNFCHNNRMAQIATRYEHIIIDAQGQTRIGNEHGFKLLSLIAEQQANNWNAHELLEQFPQLTMGQIHSALAYYWDHQVECDAELARLERQADELRSSLPVSAAQKRLSESKRG
jgi:Protein of unknown function (DUF433)